MHEAAHAVVAVRLGLPLVYTSIRGGGAGDDAISADAQRTARPGGKLVAAGHSVLERGALAQWEAVLPDPQARANLEKVSVYTAAGIVAEAKMGAALHDEGNRNDRVIVTEWRFPPGGHTGWHRHNHDYVVVPVTTGELHVFDGKTTVPAPLRAGVSYARQTGVEHDVINPNNFEFVFVEIELKA